MNKITSLLLALVFCMTPFMMVSADPKTPGDDLIETSFSGTVTDSTTQEPIQDAYVYGFDDDFREFVSDVTDEEGHYYLEFNSGGHYTLYAEHDAYETGMTETTVEINEKTVIDFELVPKVIDTRIFGTVTDFTTGEALPDVMVQFSEVKYLENGGTSRDYIGYALTDAEGKYSFEAYEGKFSVFASKEGYDPSLDEITVKSGQEYQYDIELVRWARGVYGKVTDVEGGPMSGVVVALEMGSRRSIEFSNVTDENGNYEIRVPDGGDYTLKAFEDGYRPYSKNIYVPDDSMVNEDIEMARALLPDPLLRILYLILTILGVM